MSKKNKVKILQNIRITEPGHIVEEEKQSGNESTTESLKRYYNQFIITTHSSSNLSNDNDDETEVEFKENNKRIKQSTKIKETTKDNKNNRQGVSRLQRALSFSSDDEVSNQKTPFVIIEKNPWLEEEARKQSDSKMVKSKKTSECQQSPQCAKGSCLGHIIGDKSFFEDEIPIIKSKKDRKLFNSLYGECTIVSKTKTHQRMREFLESWCPCDAENLLDHIEVATQKSCLIGTILKNIFQENCGVEARGQDNTMLLDSNKYPFLNVENSCLHKERVMPSSSCSYVSGDKSFFTDESPVIKSEKDRTLFNSLYGECTIVSKTTNQQRMMEFLQSWCPCDAENLPDHIKAAMAKSSLIGTILKNIFEENYGIEARGQDNTILLDVNTYPFLRPSTDAAAKKQLYSEGFSEICSDKDRQKFNFLCENYGKMNELDRRREMIGFLKSWCPCKTKTLRGHIEAAILKSPRIGNILMNLFENKGEVNGILDVNVYPFDNHTEIVENVNQMGKKKISDVENCQQSCSTEAQERIFLRKLNQPAK